MKKSLLVGIVLVASLALSSCVALPPPPRAGRPVVVKSVAYRPAPPKPKKQVRKAPPRLVYAKAPQRRPEFGRPGPRR